MTSNTPSPRTSPSSVIEIVASCAGPMRPSSEARSSGATRVIGEQAKARVVLAEYGARLTEDKPRGGRGGAHWLVQRCSPMTLTAQHPRNVLEVTPLERGDDTALADLFARMSDESRRRRYLAVKPRLTTRELAYLTDVDHVTHEALAAVDERGRLVAVARYAELSSCAVDVAVEVA